MQICDDIELETGPDGEVRIAVGGADIAAMVLDRLRSVGPRPPAEARAVSPCRFAEMVVRHAVMLGMREGRAIGLTGAAISERTWLLRAEEEAISEVMNSRGRAFLPARIDVLVLMDGYPKPTPDHSFVMLNAAMEYHKRRHLEPLVLAEYLHASILDEC